MAAQQPPPTATPHSSRPSTSNTSSQPSIDLSDPFAIPRTQDLPNFEVVTNTVATRDQIRAIAAKLLTLGAPQTQLAPAFWDIARHAADVGSTSNVEMVGICNPISMPRSEVAATIKEHCTLRQFCMFYANVVWNMLIKEKTPPANWARKHYRRSECFAAFDFFSGVGNPAALQQPLLRQPTDLEIYANATNTRVSIYRQLASQPRRATTAIEVSQGDTDVPRLLPPQ